MKRPEVPTGAAAGVGGQVLPRRVGIAYIVEVPADMPDDLVLQMAKLGVSFNGAFIEMWTGAVQLVNVRRQEIQVTPENYDQLKEAEKALLEKNPHSDTHEGKQLLMLSNALRGYERHLKIQLET